MMNEGLTGNDIANKLELPPVLAREWYNRGYYGSISFNSRAVYQRYMGWYDANPVHLAPYPPKEESQRYVAAMGGPQKVLGLARDAAKAGDDRWAAELGARLVMADSTDTAAREDLALVYTRLGEAAENSLWRNMYLSAADELRHGVRAPIGLALSIDLVRNMPSAMLMDLLAVRLNGDKAAAGHVSFDVNFTDRAEHFHVTVRHGVLNATSAPLPGDGPVDLTLNLTRQEFLLMTFMPGKPSDKLKAGQASGDTAALDTFVSWLDMFKPDFPILWR